MEITGNPRHDKLLELIRQNGYISVEDLANSTGVSIQTIRRDIRQLSEVGLVSRHHGGAGLPSSVTNKEYDKRHAFHTLAKKDIGQSIRTYIPDSSTLFLSIGTTMEQIATSLLECNNLRIITNSLRVANILYQNKSFDVMVTGGTLHSYNGGIIGQSAVSFVERFKADYLITSVGAIDGNDGELLEFNINEAAIVMSMMKRSRQVFVAADYSKFFASASISIGYLGNASAFFTDQAPPKNISDLLKQHNVELHVCQDEINSMDSE